LTGVTALEGLAGTLAAAVVFLAAVDVFATGFLTAAGRAADLAMTLTGLTDCAGLADAAAFLTATAGLATFAAGFLAGAAALVGFVGFTGAFSAFLAGALAVRLTGVGADFFLLPVFTVCLLTSVSAQIAQALLYPVYLTVPIAASPHVGVITTTGLKWRPKSMTVPGPGSKYLLANQCQ
jgi:hypothetical protein